MKAKQDIDVSKLTVTVPVLAELFGLSSERVRQLLAAGVFERGPDGAGIRLQAAIISYERLLAHGMRFFER